MTLMNFLYIYKKINRVKLYLKNYCNIDALFYDIHKILNSTMQKYMLILNSLTNADSYKPQSNCDIKFQNTYHIYNTVF